MQNYSYVVGYACLQSCHAMFTGLLHAPPHVYCGSKTRHQPALPFQYSPFLPYHGQLGAQPVKLDIFPRRISFCIFRGNFLKVHFLK